VVGVALWRPSALLFSWQAVSVLLVQAWWALDLVLRLVTGRHLLGGAGNFDWEGVEQPIRRHRIEAEPTAQWRVVPAEGSRALKSRAAEPALRPATSFTST
jgi:hypothetical protein